jgi:signal transduction histidine kinase
MSLTCYAWTLALYRLLCCSVLYALSVAGATNLFASSSNYYLLHLGNSWVVIFMNYEFNVVPYMRWFYPLACYASSFIALLFNATSQHILIASAVNIVEQVLMHVIMVKTLNLRDIYVFRSLRFLYVLFGISLILSFIMSLVGTVSLVLVSGDAFVKTLITYTSSHVAGNYLGLYSYYVLRGFGWRNWPPRPYIRDLMIVCTLEMLLNGWKKYGYFKQAATVQIYPLLAYIASRYNQSYTALADVLVACIVIIAVVVRRGPYFTKQLDNFSVFISLFIVLMYSACLTALLSFFMEQRRVALSKVSQLKDDLLLISSQISHDLRAPLTHVMSVCENLRYHSISDADLEEVNFSCETVSDIMESWLNILSASSSMVEAVTPEEVHLLAESEVQTLAVFVRKIKVYGNRVIILSGKQLTLHVVQTSNCLSLKFNHKMLQHVIINLVSNAIKYSEASGRIVVTANYHDMHHVLCIQVSDEGIGIADSHIPHLFDRFYRIGHAGNKCGRLETSFGIGLSIVKSLVVKMGGSVYVASKLGAGTTFNVTVPCFSTNITEPVEAEVEQKRSSSSSGLDCASFSNLRVLIVEDNPMCSYLFAKHLSDCCASVRVIEDGALVMAIIKQCRYDVILLDGNLPNKSGQEILASIQKICETLSLLPVIVTISGGMDFTEEPKPLVVEHCTKPFTKKQLFAAIDRGLCRNYDASHNL